MSFAGGAPEREERSAIMVALKTTKKAMTNYVITISKDYKDHQGQKQYGAFRELIGFNRHVKDIRDSQSKEKGNHVNGSTHICYLAIGRGVLRMVGKYCKEDLLSISVEYSTSLISLTII